MASLSLMLTQTPYLSYAYAYPHKTAYRPLEPALALSQVWDPEPKDALFLYAHIPFCEMRCGFCNLFTMAKPGQPLQDAYVEALKRQAELTRQALGPQARFARVAIGGGTPSLLSLPALEAVLDLMEHTMGADLKRLPTSCEVSPETISPDKLELLRERGVDRISIGVQSFVEQETQGARRPQPPQVLDQALTQIAARRFPIFNLDLIYGLLHQTPQSWRLSLERAVAFEPQEIFLYPLYVRPLTGLGNSARQWDDERLALYRQGRDFLRTRGYEQLSMRLFRRSGLVEVPGPVYCCQNDGMVGLGVGARSYTRQLHYSSDYAVGRRKVVSIIEEFTQRDDAALSTVHHGFRLDAQEQRRRFVIQSLLNAQGLEESLYQARFGSSVWEDLPCLHELLTLGLAQVSQGALRLNDLGMERADVIGPWLYSEPVRALSAEYELA